jgi:hypothetical protein
MIARNLNLQLSSASPWLESPTKSATSGVYIREGDSYPSSSALLVNAELTL